MMPLFIVGASLYPTQCAGGIPGMFQCAQNLFPVGAAFTLAIFFVAFAIMKARTDGVRSFTVASFISAIVALIFLALGMINEMFFYAGVVFTAVGILALYFRGDQG